MKKKLIIPMMAGLFLLTGCYEETETDKDKQATMEIADKLTEN